MPPKAKPDTAAYQKLKKDIKEGTIGTLYVFHGEEAYLRDFYLGQLKKKLLPAGMEEFNLHTFQPKECDPKRLEQAVDKLVMDGQTDRRSAFLDEVVMGEVLGEVKEIAARGGIACGCGSAEYGVKVGFSAVDLVCARCGATLRLNAATPDDIDAVCAQYTLTIPGKKEQGL